MGAALQRLPYCIDAIQLQDRLREIGWNFVLESNLTMRKRLVYERAWGDRHAELVIMLPAPAEWSVPNQCVFSVEIRPGREYLP